MVRARFLGIYVLSKPHPVVLWVIVMAGWWWWCWWDSLVWCRRKYGDGGVPLLLLLHRKQPYLPPSIPLWILCTMLSHQYHTTVYYIHCMIPCMYCAQKSNHSFRVAAILLCAVYSLSVCAFQIKNVQSAVRSLVKASGLL